jgi:hypothetical protein
MIELMLHPTISFASYRFWSFLLSLRLNANNWLYIPKLIRFPLYPLTMMCIHSSHNYDYTCRSDLFSKCLWLYHIFHEHATMQPSSVLRSKKGLAGSKLSFCFSNIYACRVAAFACTITIPIFLGL